MELYLVRHTEPFAIKGICYGQTDVKLPSNYSHLHEKIKNQLPDYFDAIYSSPLSRCKLLADALSPLAQTDSRLMELNFGAWEGKKWDAINREVLDDWAMHYVEKAPPEGETLQAMSDRFGAFVQDIKPNAYNKIAVITHGGIIRCAMHLFSGVPLQEVMTKQVEYGSIHKFEI